MGGAETYEFIRQTDELVAHWADQGIIIGKFTEAGADHFDLVERLADRDSELFSRVITGLK